MARLSPDLLTLVDEAGAAGLRLQVGGPDLVLQGPRSAKSVALRLLERKLEVLALLQPTYMLPWPEMLPDFSCRRVDAYAPCTGGPGNVVCFYERWTFVRYGDVPTCLRCALYAIESAVVVTTRPPTPKAVSA